MKLKAIKIVLYLVLSLGIVCSCSSLKSGQYVQVNGPDSLDQIAKNYNTSKEAIVASNEGKSMTPGSWIFVPLDRGIVETARKAASIENAPVATDPKSLFSESGFLWPVPSSTSVTSNFGWRWGRPHEGVDIGARVGSNIVAAQDGVIVYSGDEIGGYGNITVIAHKGGYFTVYAHASKNFTREGQRVYRGQVIAQVGLTGRTYGPHLHFEVRKNGVAIDPEKYLASSN